MKTYSVIVKEVLQVQIPDVQARSFAEAEEIALSIYSQNMFDCKQSDVEVTEIEFIQED